MEQQNLIERHAVRVGDNGVRECRGSVQRLEDGRRNANAPGLNPQHLATEEST